MIFVQVNVDKFQQIIHYTNCYSRAYYAKFCLIYDLNFSVSFTVIIKDMNV